MEKNRLSSYIMNLWKIPSFLNDRMFNIALGLNVLAFNQEIDTHR